MNKTLILSVLMLIGALSACQKDEVDKVDAPAQTIQQAKARLVARQKWVLNELSVNKQVVYKRNSYNPYEIEFWYEWFRFNDDGTFETKYTDDPETEKAKYEIDEATNRIVFFFNGIDDTVYTEEYTIEAGAVYTDHFSMSTEFEGDTYVFKLVPLP